MASRARTQLSNFSKMRENSLAQLNFHTLDRVIRAVPICNRGKLCKTQLQEVLIMQLRHTIKRSREDEKKINHSVRLLFYCQLEKVELFS